MAAELHVRLKIPIHSGTTGPYYRVGKEYRSACVQIPDGFYRLVKWKEDGNPVFPSRETVVEVKQGKVINLTTGRSSPVRVLSPGRSLFGPLKGPYDTRKLRQLPRIDLP